MTPEYNLSKEDIRKLIKSLAAYEGTTLTRLKMDINHKYDKSDTLENLTNKLRNKTVKVSELLEIFDVLDYEVIVRKR